MIYHPDAERHGNYVPTVLDQRYDAFLYCDHTTPLRPLHPVEPPDVEPPDLPLRGVSRVRTMREMRVLTIGVDVQHDAPVLLLQEATEGHRILPVWVGFAEAAAIEVERRYVPTPRPTSHRLIGDIIAAFAHRVEQVCVTALRDTVFHAELVLDGGTRISARVSDAVALALHLGVPIRAEDVVLDEAALADAVVVDMDEATGQVQRADRPSDEAAEIQRFRRFIDSASPEDFDR